MMIGKPRLLVVEDDADVLRFLEMAFEPRFELTLARSAEEALRIWEGLGEAAEAPDVVFSDIHMKIGSFDGLELARRITKGRRRPTPPIVVATGYSRYTEQDATESGASALVYKPFSLEAVENLLDRLVRSNRARRDEDGRSPN
jgi:CheY-like chemotaxis protein